MLSIGITTLDSNKALTVVLPPTFTKVNLGEIDVPPRKFPSQRTKREPIAGDAINSSAVPVVTLALQISLQLIAAPVVVWIVPLPTPIFITNRFCPKREVELLNKNNNNSVKYCEIDVLQINILVPFNWEEKIVAMMFFLE